MSYKKAYLHVFNRLTDLIHQLETLTPDEEINTLLCLQQIQIEGESAYLEEHPK